MRKALAERRTRLQLRASDPVRRERLRRFLEREVWAWIPEDQLGRAPSKAERESILGYGWEGV